MPRLPQYPDCDFGHERESSRRLHSNENQEVVWRQNKDGDVAPFWDFSYVKTTRGVFILWPIRKTLRKNWNGHVSSSFYNSKVWNGGLCGRFQKRWIRITQIQKKFRTLRCFLHLSLSDLMEMYHLFRPKFNLLEKKNPPLRDAE
jgi:hypothetical protein